jgi:hypothetical protein
VAVSDIINSQAEELMVSVITKAHPGLDLRPTTPQYDVYIRPLLPLFSDILARLADAERKSTPLNYDQLTPAEMRAKAAREEVAVSEGHAATGSVRVKLTQPAPISLSPASTITINGQIYHPHGVVVLPATALELDAVLGFYYADFIVDASGVGTAYNAPIGTPVAIDAFAGNANLIESVVSAGIEGGREPDTNREIYDNIVLAKNQRNLVNPPSTEGVIRRQFPGLIGRLLVVGAQDPEMLRDLVDIVDPTLGTIQLHWGNHVDVYVQTPIVRQAIEVAVPSNATTVDLSAYRAVLKIHSVSIKNQPGAHPYYALGAIDPRTRFSAQDPAVLVIDPAVAGQTLVIDLSYAPDVVAIQAFVDSPEQRLTGAVMLVRYFHPVFASANIYVEGASGKIAAADVAIDRYLAGISGSDLLVVSRLTDAIHSAGISLVHQDYDVTLDITFGDGTFATFSSSTGVALPNRYDKGFSQRVSVLVDDGIQLSALS